MVRPMASRWSVIVLVAGVTATTIAFAQPIRSPREVSDAPSKVEPKKTDAKKVDAKKTSAKKTSAKPTAAKPTKATAKKPAAKHVVSKTSAKKSAKPLATKKRAVSTKSKTAPKTTAAVTPKRSYGRGDNMPRGFEWPASPAMLTASKACEADLDAMGIAWKRADPEGRIVDPIEVPSGVLGGVKYTSKWRTPPHKLDCQLARALALIGKDLHAIGVREVKWGSMFRWSNVRTQGTELPYLSRHALGLAIDIVEFVDDTGRVANVQKDYLNDDALLLESEHIANTSGKFRIVLTPRNDPKSHHDHFHFEANPDFTAP